MGVHCDVQFRYPLLAPNDSLSFSGCLTFSCSLPPHGCLSINGSLFPFGCLPWLGSLSVDHYAAASPLTASAIASLIDASNSSRTCDSHSCQSSCRRSAT